MDLEKRKHVRLKEYDYGADGCYFVTVCIKDRKPILSTIPADSSLVGWDAVKIAKNDSENYCDGTSPVGRDALIPPPATTAANTILIPILTPIGLIADKYVQNINTVYEGVTVDNYVIMPNHIHLLISINHQNMPDSNGGIRGSRPTLHTIVRSFKTMVTREIKVSIWQASYYDRVIRDDKGFINAMQYINENSQKWSEDELYTR